MGVSVPLVFILLLPCLAAEAPVCCPRATGSCKNVCEQLSLISMATDPDHRQRRLKELKVYCPDHLSSFWRCMRQTMADFDMAKEWVGSSCCNLPQSRTCKLACIRARVKSDVLASCRRSDEVAFYSCVGRQELGEECCGATEVESCGEACRDVFRAGVIPSKHLKDRVREKCQEDNVIQCVTNHTKTTPATNRDDFLECCETGAQPQCRKACINALKTKTSVEEILESLEHGCGRPLLGDRLWDCIFKKVDSGSKKSSNSEVSRIDKLGMDSAKLHCCFKAISPTCRRLCFKTYSKEWKYSFNDLDAVCLSKASEVKLRQCILEVDKPCELGCEGLRYCTNFNNRPAEMFQSCDLDADRAARYDVGLWQENHTIIFQGVHLKLKAMNSCHPDRWKAVACMLHVKPCTRMGMGLIMCRSDCYELLSECVAEGDLPMGHSVASVCSLLLGENDSGAPCTPLSRYTSPSTQPYVDPRGQVTMPCRDNPCESNQVCTVNSNCKSSRDCMPYKCTPGCKLGEVSNMLVPEDSYVRIPHLSSGQKGCQKICKCSASGILGSCEPLPCVPFQPCWMGNRRFEHGKQFRLECNVCSCFAGVITCSMRQCSPDVTPDAPIPSLLLPCSCQSIYEPICASNGKTYPNSCLARCDQRLGHDDFVVGPCESIDPCASSPCRKDQTCVPKPQTCLRLVSHQCNQYQCVTQDTACLSAGPSPVCDVRNQQHYSVCHLIQRRATLAYWGPCQADCDLSQTVCGVNGHTYSSECAAWADYVTVDYQGKCRALGKPQDFMREMCRGIECPKLSDTKCVGATPPGACCPVCGGVLLVLFSKIQVDRAVYVVRTPEPFTVQAVVARLRDFVQVKECTVFGYLSIEGEIIILVVPTLRQPSQLQLATCVAVAGKLERLIQQGSSHIASDLTLSSLTLAQSIHVPRSRASSLTNSYLTIAMLLHGFWRCLR